MSIIDSDDVTIFNPNTNHEKNDRHEVLGGNESVNLFHFLPPFRASREESREDFGSLVFYF